MVLGLAAATRLWLIETTNFDAAVGQIDEFRLVSPRAWQVRDGRTRNKTAVRPRGPQVDPPGRCKSPGDRRRSSARSRGSESRPAGQRATSATSRPAMHRAASPVPPCRPRRGTRISPDRITSGAKTMVPDEVHVPPRPNMRIGHRRRRAIRQRHLPQLAAAEERQRPAVRRPERFRRIVAPRNGLCVQRLERAHEKSFPR